MLMLNVKFALYSLKVDLENKQTRCLNIDGNVSFKNNDNNGQVVIKLTTLTFPIKCQWSTNIQKQCEVDNKDVVIVFAFLTSIEDFVAFVLGLIILAYIWRFKSYPYTECFRNIQWWNLVSVAGGICSIVGIYRISDMLTEQLEEERVLLSKWDNNLVLLGSGCLLTWFSVVRFFRIHKKFTLLIKTLQRAAGDLILFLIWVVLIFIGFWLYCYIVLGPYHFKFQKMSTAAETFIFNYQRR
ncbi:mucolipin-1-like [Ruditapes philippinarum]|uniref:mucolipin-1-like n=1 Tax=Ruditapes philippinarum TaxID=129788 RepID=UPI00295BE009|nr:mucolipin-1-like [Ruditapes philippinarum]